MCAHVPGKKIAWLKGEMPAKQCEINIREMKEEMTACFSVVVLFLLLL